MLKSRFLWKLYAGYSMLIVISTVVIGVLISRGIERDALDEIRQSLVARASILKQPSIAELQGTGVEGFQAYIKALGTEIGTRLTVMRADGVVIADSEEDPGVMDNHADRPEVLAARAKGIGDSTRFSDTLKVSMMYLALPLGEGGDTLGYIRTSLPLSRIDERLDNLQTAIIWGTVLSAAAALGLGFLLAHHFVKPLSTMTVVAGSMSQGDYDQRLPMSRNDEIGRLAKAFNVMAESCRDRTETIITDRNRLSAILAGMTEGVVAVEKDERVLHMNEAAARLLGVSAEDCLGKPIWEAVRVPDIPEILGAVVSGQTGSQGGLQISAQLKKDQFIEVNASGLHDGQGELVGAVAVIHDVSEFNKLAMVRREFVANASHELKTPITAIRGLVETLIDDKDLDEAKSDRFLGKIKDQSMRLSAIVSDLLTLSRLESERDESEDSPFDLRQIVQSMAQTFSQTGQEKGIAVETDITDKPVNVMGDAAAIRQLMSNLLDNAVKYTPEGGRIDVRLLIDGDKTAIEVQDTGIGINPKDQARIFERFYRVDKARSRELGGTGLGLSIVRHIAITHGGGVTVQSKPGGGSTFRVTLPTASIRENGRPQT